MLDDLDVKQHSSQLERNRPHYPSSVEHISGETDEEELFYRSDSQSNVTNESLTAVRRSHEGERVDVANAFTTDEIEEKMEEKTTAIDFGSAGTNAFATEERTVF